MFEDDLAIIAHHVQPGVVLDDPRLPLQQSSGESYAALNSQQREFGLRWVSGIFLRFGLVCFRLILEPLRCMMKTLLFWGTEEWEQLQQAEEIKALQEGLATDESSMYCREYQLTMLCSGVLESKCLEKLRYLIHEPEMWSLLDDSVPEMDLLTEQCNSHVFKSISRAGACVTEQFVQRRKRYPLKLFRLIKEPEIAKEIESDEDCLKGTFASAFLSSNKLTDALTRWRLLVMAMIMHISIVQLESLNASLRRIVTKLSANTTAIDLVQTSAHVVSSRFRNRCAGNKSRAAFYSQCGLDPRSGTSGQATESKEEAKRPARGGGGAWLAFIANADEGLFKDFSDLAIRYRQLDAAETQQYLDAVRVGTR